MTTLRIKPQISHISTDFYQGNVRAVGTGGKYGSPLQITHYYPYGLPFAEGRGASVNRYKYTGKELITEDNLNFYDFDARLQWPDIPVFNRPDPKEEDYLWLSPYTFCAANPVKYTDPTGKDIAILLTTAFKVGHIAMLIQNADNKWGYYSFNGTDANFWTSGSFGLEYNNVGTGEWNSPEEFLESNFNSKNVPEGGSKSDVANYEYEKAYVIPTSKTEDGKMRQKFADLSWNAYDVWVNNCAHTVQNTVKAAGLTDKTDCKLPQSAYDKIKEQNPNGTEIIKKPIDEQDDDINAANEPDDKRKK